MKVSTLFDASGKIHALYRSSAQPGAPALRFRPAPGYRVELLEIPAELQHLNLGQLHGAVKVHLGPGSPRLLSRSGRADAAEGLLDRDT